VLVEDDAAHFDDFEIAGFHPLSLVAREPLINAPKMANWRY
jgi:hypothetical protein